jgi:hypothetical protein
MTDSTLDSDLLFLYNKFGSANLVGHVPRGGFTGSEHHNVSSAAYPIGTVVRVEHRATAGKPGYSEFVYLKVGTQNASSLIAAKSVVVQDSATQCLLVTNDPDDCIAIPTPFGAIALSAMTDAYYGWFWCGGVCPEDYVSGLAGNYATNGSVAAGNVAFGDLSADKCGLVPASVAGTTAALKIHPCGFALAADA